MKKLLLLPVFIIFLLLGCNLAGEGSHGPNYVGTWKGEDIDVSGITCDVEVILTETSSSINLYFPDTNYLLFNSNKGTHGEFTESTKTTDVWNEITLTEEYDGADWQPIDPPGSDLDYAAFRIEGTTMHFKYDTTDDHDYINAQGELVKQ